MLIFISDLHLDDRTAGIQFLDHTAFEHAFTEIGNHARKAGSTFIELVFLGDVFDLVRTTGWFHYPPSERPWGISKSLPEPEAERRLSAIQSHAKDLLDQLVKVNRRVFDIFQDVGKFTRPLSEGGYGFPVEPRRTYIPGNHDRICNQFEELRQTVALLLGVERIPGKPFPYIYSDIKYRAFARHGHEWDTWNSEFTSLPPLSNDAIYGWNTYLDIPIGEVIATELASKLAPAVQRRLKGVLSDVDSRVIADQFKIVDDVRPVAAIIPWLFDRLNTYDHEISQEDVLNAIKAGVDDVLKDFANLDFVREWIHTHDTINPFDAASLLKDVLYFGRKIPSGILQHLVPAAQKLLALRESDNLASKASSDFDRLDRLPGGEEQYLYVLYGHTHKPDQIPIEVTPKQHEPRVYLNTGTWRPTHRQGLKQHGFISWKSLTYTLIYHPEDDPLSQASKTNAVSLQTQPYPTFETWTGNLEEHPVTEEEVTLEYAHLLQEAQR